MWYNINYSKLAILLLPTFLRKPKMSAFVQALLFPIERLHYQWKLKREADWYKINHTGQVCKFRKALNDTLDPQERRIYFEEGNSFPRKYIYTRAENKPVYLGKMFIYRNAEYVGTGADFIVFIPADIIATQFYKIESIIKFYKLASKRYQIRPI